MKDIQNRFTTKVKLTIRSDGEGFFGPGIAELLERTEECGSVKEACRMMELSYTKGRRIIRRAEEKLGFPLIEIRHGGTGGGASCLTEQGRNYTQNYRRLEAEAAEYAAKLFQEAGRLLPEQKNRDADE